FGKTGFFNGKPQIVHPEMELINHQTTEIKSFLEPVYPTTEKLKAKGLNGRQLGKLTQVLFQQIQPKDILENLPSNLLQKLKLINRYQAYVKV
ncbi:hypothetical protein ABTA58_19810, partial [Acinetobacter baumannii]